MRYITLMFHMEGLLRDVAGEDIGLFHVKECSLRKIHLVTWKLK